MTNNRLHHAMTNFQRIAMHRSRSGQPLFRMTDRDRDQQRVNADLRALADRLGNDFVR